MINSEDAQSIVVVGGGIIGLSVALRLQCDGYRVILLERGDVMQECSAGNAGHLAESNIFPPASLGTLLQIPRLILSKNGPLAIQPTYLPKMIRWGVHVKRTLRAQDRRGVTDVLASLTLLAYDALFELAKIAEASHFLSRDGALVVFKTTRALEEKCEALETWNRYGLKASRLDKRQCLALEPSLTHEIVGGVYFQNSGRCSNPQGLGLKYAEALIRNGGEIRKVEVLSINPRGSGLELTSTVGAINAVRAIVCAGYWSGGLLRDFSPEIPIVSERGYHLTLPEPCVSLQRPVVFGEPYFAATPMDMGLRLAGTAEFADPNAPPQMERATALLRLAKQYLPHISGQHARPWMGIRPSLPDGLPAIGATERSPNLLYAFGHGHNGLTLSGVTAECLARALSGRDRYTVWNALDISRFSRSSVSASETSFIGSHQSEARN